MINISEASKEYMKRTLSVYKDVDELPNVLPGRTILHLYPVADTMDDDENLDGYIDALLFDVHIYNCDKEEKYVIKSRDQIELNFPARVRIFKDQSTMIILDRPVKIGYYQSLEIHQV